MINNNSLDFIGSPLGPYVVACTFGDEISLKIEGLKNEGSVSVREIDCERACSINEFYVEIAKQLDFPDYFGRNLNALSDCMEDERLKEERPFVLRLSKADYLLTKELSAVLHGFISTFNSIGRTWACAVEEGEEWDSKARRFLVILEYSQSNFVGG